ncbi:hypothetical protein MYAM1_002366 [Malassezia yamatoensis]|uniref:6-phosphofructo-2-kinase domain-containing protein n=1 Tax=Malassezia yamatoensis TaxID=253288 RepID=A0AAJ5YVR9_9BASI|nr:hypothetical protein MYAM1_002366 [Malassezia yamatoensis]
MAAPLYSEGKILVVTVGLPARGKTHLAHAIQRYLLWLGVKCKVFNLANVRRDVLGPLEDLPGAYFGPGPKSEKIRTMKRRVRERLQEQIDSFFDDGGQVAVFDANNSSQAERHNIRQRFSGKSIQVMFIECICDDDTLVEQNIQSIYQSNPDYSGWNFEDVMKSFKLRIEDHQKYYEPITDPSFPYVQMLNLGQRISMNNVHGYLQNRIIFFLMNIHNRERTIYFARAGEALVEHSYKSDAELSSLGKDYASRLCQFVMALRKDHRAIRTYSPAPSQKHRVSWLSNSAELKRSSSDAARSSLQVWCSTRRRSVQTAAPFRLAGCKVVELSRLCEMHPGVVDGMSSEEIAARFPDSIEGKARDPYRFRFPRAESYHDLALRLEPIIFELERTQEDVLIVGQSSVLRCLIAYLQGNKPAEIPFIQVREGDLVEILPQAFGVSSHVYSFWNPEEERQHRDMEFAARTSAALAEESCESDATEADPAVNS